MTDPHATDRARSWRHLVPAAALLAGTHHGRRNTRHSDRVRRVMSRRIALGTALLALVACLFPLTPAAATGHQSGERLIATRTSLLGTHRWYQQTYGGVDVLDGIVGDHSYRTGGSSRGGRPSLVTDAPSLTPAVPAARALAKAGPDADGARLAIQAGAPSRLVWVVSSIGPDGSTRTLVDARTGAVVEARSADLHVDGTGTVFNPNPVVTLQDRSLADAGDANLPAFAPAYQSVPLHHLDGSGYLRGDFVDVTVPGGARVFSPTLAFDFDRSSSGFSQTMAYHHLTTAQEYIQQLGFSDVNNHPQQVVADGTPGDFSYFAPDAGGVGTIVYGTGGVDDAEDADILWHEYGHAIQQNQVPGFASGGDTSPIGEGFSDYWAVTMSQPVNGGFDVPCVADWNTPDPGTGERCLRRVDLDLRLADRTGAVHHDGQIWSRALWDINQALGRDAANTLILESQFAFSPTSTFSEAAIATIDTAQRLFGGGVAGMVRKAFKARGISTKVTPPPAPPHDLKPPAGLREVARVGAPAPGGSTYEDLFEPYDLNDRGDALFASNVGSGGQAVFVGDHTSIEQVARSGDPAPGGGVFGFGVVAGPGIDRKGNVAFSYFLEPFELPVGRNAGVYRSGPGGTSPVVVPGVTASPTGGVFVGAGDLTSTNDRGDIAFTGMITTPNGISDGLGMGIFLARPNGSITGLVVPGDMAPGLGTFDYAVLASINAAGDVAFTGHLAGTPCESGAPQTTVIGCHRSLFLRRANGQIVRLAQKGAAAPGGGTFLDALHPVLSDNRDVVFMGVVDTGGGYFLGVFIARAGRLEAIAREGQPMPGGGQFVFGGFQPGNADINDHGDVAFSATLDTDIEGDGLLDQGLYRWGGGKLTLVVRSGMVLPAGHVIAMQPLATLGSFEPFSGAAINNARRMLWQVTVVDDTGQLQTVLYTSR